METVNDKKRKERYMQEFQIASCFGPEPPAMLLLHYSPGEFLTTPFSPSQYIQFIVEGNLLLYNMPDESSTVILQTNFNKVTLLGESEMLDNGFNPFFVEAATDVYTLAFLRDRYQEQLLNDPVFLRFICRTLSDKLAESVRDSQSGPLKTRVLRSLCMAEPDQRFSSISNIAVSIGVSKRQLLRVLKELCGEGVLEHEKKGVYRLLKKPDSPGGATGGK